MAQHAILVAITWYPGLTELKGPENDAEDMRKWLCDDADGPKLHPTNDVTVIKSSDFEKVADRFKAQPAEVAFRQALSQLVFQPDGVTFRNKVGERLYLFFAGHGFAGKRRSEAALYTAQASKVDPDHIPSKRYAERIANSGAFEEVVLVMDCCRDVDLSDSIRDPNIKMPDRQGLVKTRFLEAYSAGRGEQAREREITPGGPVRGLFTYALVDALRNAPPNKNNEVTGAVVRDHVFNRWPKFFEGAAPHEPEIAPPLGAKDIVFARRKAAKVEVRFRLSPPAPAPGTAIVIENGDRAEIDRVPYDPAGTRAFLSDGLYKAKLDGSGRWAHIDASGVSVEVTL